MTEKALTNVSQHYTSSDSPSRLITVSSKQRMALSSQTKDSQQRVIVADAYLLIQDSASLVCKSRDQVQIRQKLDARSKASALSHLQTIHRSAKTAPICVASHGCSSNGERLRKALKLLAAKGGIASPPPRCPPKTVNDDTKNDEDGWQELPVVKLANEEDIAAISLHNLRTRLIRDTWLGRDFRYSRNKSKHFWNLIQTRYNLARQVGLDIGAVKEIQRAPRVVTAAPRRAVLLIPQGKFQYIEPDKPYTKMQEIASPHRLKMYKKHRGAIPPVNANNAQAMPDFSIRENHLKLALYNRCRKAGVGYERVY